MKHIPRNPSWYVALFALCLSFFLLAAGTYKISTDQKMPFLVSEGGASWIRLRAPFQLNIHEPMIVTTVFRYRLDMKRIPSEAILTVRAMKQAAVYLDGAPLFRSPQDSQRWKESYHINLAPYLRRGGQELRIDVLNENGHPTLLAYCIALGIQTGDRWEASGDGRQWLPALPVDDMPPLGISRIFQRADSALWSLYPVYLPLFLLVFLWSYTKDQLRPGWRAKIHLSAGAVRWLLLAAWLVMTANNFRKIPISMGMDYEGHTKYISYIFAYWRIPLATEGWQMFQPPLFHFLAAAFFKSLLPFFNTETAIRILKLLPLLCGAAQIEICYRTMRYAYPAKTSLQIIGTLLGGLLPMNLFMSQSLGNEPLVGFLTALIVLFMCKIFSDDSAPGRKTQIIMGFLLGLAILTKVTAILIIPPVLFFVFFVIFQKRQSFAEGIYPFLRFNLIFLGTALVTSGWYYLYNVIEMGRFFVGGWDPSRGIIWWQDPGYRTFRQCYVFGESLFYPVYSSIHGFWDSLYSTFWMDGFLSCYYPGPWNYDFMLGAVWLSLLPTVAIIIGGIIALLRKSDKLRLTLRFAASSILIYLVAIFYIFLTVPILSSAKATYALGLIPCFALLGATGFDVLTRWRFVRAVVYGLFACWVVGVYSAYFVI
jgi:hypothetical protein